MTAQVPWRAMKDRFNHRYGYCIFYRGWGWFEITMPSGTKKVRGVKAAKAFMTRLPEASQ